MIRLFAMILMAPFWVHFLFAGGVMAIGHYSHDASSKGLAEKMRLAQAAPPLEIAISAFASDAPRSFPVEVNLRAQVAIAHNVELVKTKNGKTLSERAMYILLDRDAEPDTKRAYGAVILDPSEVDMFADWAAQKVASNGGMGSFGPILAFDGLRGHPRETGHIMDALADQGFTAAPNFTYIDPFMQGRAAGLAIKSRDKPLDIAYTYYGAAFFVFLGILKLGLRIRRNGQGPSAMAPAAKIPTAAAIPEMPIPTSAAPPASNDFIGALARKAADQGKPKGMTNAAQAKLNPAIAAAHPADDGMRGSWRSKLRPLAGFGGVLLLYLVFAGFGSSFGLPSHVSVMGLFGAKPAVTEVMMVQTPQAPSPAANPPPAPRPHPVQAAAPTAGALLTATQAPTPLWAALPLWLWASLLALIVALPVLFIAGSLVAMRGKGAAKSTRLDPYERLLQRRLAEKERGQTAVMGGMGLLRA